MKTAKQLKWALVLSGGGAKGLAHLGVLKALEELRVNEPSLVVGTSMGAIVGGLYASGMSPREMTRFVLEDFDIGKYLDSFVFRLGGPVGKVFQAGQILGSLAGKRGIDSGEQILALLERLTGGKTIEQARIPFRCNAVDLVSGREVIFDQGSLARAMRASMSFPAFFEPLIEGDLCLADGGLADNMPVAVARRAGFNQVLAVDVGYLPPVSLEDLKSAPQIVYRSMQTVQRLMQVKLERANLTIHAADTTTPFSFLKKRELITLGERAVQKSVPALEAFFGRRSGAWFFRRRCRDCGIGPRSGL
jgi:NTE family protein